MWEYGKCSQGDNDIDIKCVWKWNYLGLKESTMCEGHWLEKTASKEQRNRPEKQEEKEVYQISPNNKILVFSKSREWKESIPFIIKRWEGPILKSKN